MADMFEMSVVEQIRLPPRGRRRLFWWLVTASLLVMLSGITVLKDWGAVGWLAIAGGLYSGVICLGFSLYPREIPYSLEILCVGNIEEEFYSLMWGTRQVMEHDVVDRTWRLPALAAAILLIGFAGQWLGNWG